jgi:hypothetical protein
VTKIQSVLYNEGIPSPRGRPVWDRRVLRKIISSDDYRPLSFEEISELVAPEVAARLDECKAYGVQWYNRDKAVTRSVSEPDGSGGRRYRKRKTLVRRPREEWLAIPVPTSERLPRDLVDLARATMDANQGSERKRLAREWELRGVMRCSCGTKLKTKTMMPEGRGPYHYYICMRRFELRGMCLCTQKAIRATHAEEAIWGFISRLLKDPERIRLGMDRLIDEERVAASRGDPHSTAKAWADKAAECARLRAAYQDQQAAGLMTLEELGSKLSELDEMRRHAEREVRLTGAPGARRAARRGQRRSYQGDGRDGAGCARQSRRRGAQQGLSDAQIGGDSYTRGVLDYRSPESAYAEWHGCARGDTGDRA